MNRIKNYNACNTETSRHIFLENKENRSNHCIHNIYKTSKKYYNSSRVIFMERYDIKNHLFFDGYDLTEECLKDVEYLTDFINKINANVFDNKGKITIIPYFNGKIKEDGGVSGIILGNNFHFTCHTFCFKSTVFIDYYGSDSKKDLIKKLIIENFNTENYDMGCKDIKGNFGKHIIMNASPISFDEAMNKVETLLKDIEMTPITVKQTNKVDDKNFDILQPIAESHISLHQHYDFFTIDIFSCKYFDVQKVLKVFSGIFDVIEVNRGLQYK